MTAPETVHELVAKFDQHRKEYQTHKNETELRREFLDPFFEALGWDVFNKKSYSERFKEVLHEASVEVEGKAKAADYAFRAGDKTIFFVEAKKPSVNIGENPEPAFQLRRYGWSAKLPVSILTDFEQLAVYECRTKPSKKDKASFGRVKLYHYSEYIEKWDEIAGVFSREAVLQGAFEQFAEEAKGKKGTAQVDDAFLEEIERWRDMLARNIALRNPSIQNERELNYAVQLTIDRIIFLRIGEDRGIEPEGQLQEIGNPAAIGRGNGEQVYAELVALFRRADTRYNSGLFHFSNEQGQSSNPDSLTPDLQIDDKVLKDILHNLYYPESPYVFTYLSADILGQVYEQFLGKVIRLTEGHRAKVEEKPEVRKAGGVYYTPTYIVNYIVENTVGKLVEGKTPGQVANLKVLDPACGSGSFLLGAYQFLLNWHDDWYTHNQPEKWAKGKEPAIYQAIDGDWRLTTNERKRILLNNIYGVDIDAQAVEVTKLSLLLKVLEGESGQLTLGFERVLPDLGENIKCGNSLIGSDYYDERQMPLLPDEEFYRINAFDWKKEFASIFVQSGFDAIIGNPPYVRMEAFKEIKDYLRKNYACHEERSDIYAYIIERVHKIMKQGGLFGMIVSNKFLRANYGKPLRDFIQENASVNKVVDFAGLPVFKGATVRTIILLTSRESQKESLQYSPPLSVDIFSSVEAEKMVIANAIEKETYLVASETLTRDVWSFAPQEVDELVSRLSDTNEPLVEYCDGHICMGVKSGLTKAFVIDAETRNRIVQENPKAEEIIKPFLNGRDIRRFALHPKDIYLIYTYRGIDISKYPSIENHLKPYKEKLKKRATKQEWYELQQPQFAYVDYFENPKIVFPDIATKPRFVLDEHGHYGSNTMYFIPRNDLYLLGLLNSKLAQFYFEIVCAGLEGKNDTYLRFFGQYLEGFPVAGYKESQHEKMVSLIETMLELHKRQASAKTPQEKDMLARQIESTDGAIDRLVYELYGLTEEEVKIVEGES